MTAALELTHIRLDETGRALVEDTNIKVIEIAADYLAHGSSVEEMALQFPHLTPAQIHSALAYYYDHQALFDAELQASRAHADDRWKAVLGSPIRRKLQALGKLP